MDHDMPRGINPLRGPRDQFLQLFAAQWLEQRHRGQGIHIPGWGRRAVGSFRNGRNGMGEGNRCFAEAGPDEGLSFRQQGASQPRPNTGPQHGGTERLFEEIETGHPAPFKEAR